MHIKKGYSIMAICALSIAPLLGLQVNANGSVTGNVFIDFNANGSKDSAGLKADENLGGVTVELFEQNGFRVDTTTTDDNGNYELTTTAEGPFRVEFTTPDGYTSSSFGPDNGSSVQFVDNGGTANFGVTNPDDFCTYNGFLTTSCFLAGNVEGDALVHFPYYYTTDLDGSVLGDNQVSSEQFVSRTDELMPTPIGWNDEIGTVYGLAYEQSSETIYSSSFVRRKSKLGGLSGESTGAIYATSNIFGEPSSAVYADLNEIFGADTAGINPHYSEDPNTDFNDDGGMRDLVGKVGLGDLEISRDGNSLYTVNLANKSLYQIPLNETPDEDNINVFPIPSTNDCDSGDVRPFGLGIDMDDNVLVGGVCSGENSGDTEDIRAYVWGLNGNSFDLVLSEPLALFRGGTDFQEWYVWQVFPDDTNNSEFPQPMLTDIEFEGDNIILGFRDRYGDQTPAAFKFPTDDPWSRGYGDILKAFPDENGGWELNNEFYPIEEPGENEEDEATSGALAVLPGGAEVATTAFDAVNRDSSDNEVENNYNTGGIQLYDNTTGLQTGAYDVYLASYLNTMGKTNGLGDLEFICENAPVEIGNRVWIDEDRDGVQDANEPALAGIEITLENDGEVIATAVTDENGNYIFSSLNGATTDALIYGLDLDSNTEYDVVIGAAQSGLSGYTLTTANSGSATNRDSDGLGQGGDYVATVTPSETNHTIDFGFITTGFGSAAPMGTIGTLLFEDINNDGVFNDGDVRLPNVTLDLYLDENSNCSIDPSETVVRTLTTDDTGEYLFENLLLNNNYIVSVSGEDVNLSLNTFGAADTDNNSQTANSYCVTISNTNPDIVYADFGFSLQPQDTTGLIRTGGYDN